MTTETGNGEEAGKPQTSGQVKIEWNWDLDEEWNEIKSVGLGDQKYALGEEGRFQLKGRCRRCWGGLIGKTEAGREPTAIRCRVCGLLLEGDKAREEYQRMSKESGLNTSGMVLGMRPKHRADATFVQKIFPYMDRLSAEEFSQRSSDQARKGGKKGRLTRSSFPAGSAGFLFLQARALMSGMERLPRELSVARFWDVDMNEDGSATVHIPTEQLGEHSKTSEKELMKSLGSTMTIALMSAFACELAMKAIGLTRRDEVRKSHDLWELYSGLPEDSRARIEEDFPEAGSVMEDARHTFGKWRYFEVDVGARGIGAMIDTGRAFSLAKAARVLLDEAELMGLGYSVHIEATRQIAETAGRRDTHVKQCAVERHRPSAGANPARQLSLQPVAIGAGDGGNDIA